MTTVTEQPARTLEKGYIGQSIPRREDKRLVQGQGVFFVDVSKALELEGVYGTLTGDEVAISTDPFFELSVEPGGNIKDYALAVGRARFMGEPVAAVCAATRELARDAADLVEVEYEPLPALTDGLEALKEEVVLHEDAGSNVVWSGVFSWGDVDQALAEADHVVKIDRLHFHRFSSTPLECSGALVEYDRGMGEWTIHCNHQMPGVGAIWMAPALRVGIDKIRFVTQDIGGGFGNKICLHPQFVVLCLLARKLGRPVQWTEWRTDQHTANAHGNERIFLDVEVAVRSDGEMTGFKVRAVDDCGAFPRYEPLGCIIWAQVTPGMYAWRNVQVDFTQVCTNKSPVSPNRGYSRMQHLWLTERIIDIVAAELGFDPVEIRKRNYVKAEQMPYETPATTLLRSISRST
jgi:2-furoyl-CoA dehydrogenase large subunit